MSTTPSATETLNAQLLKNRENVEMLLGYYETQLEMLRTKIELQRSSLELEIETHHDKRADVW